MSIETIYSIKNRYLPVKEMRITAGADQKRGKVTHGAIDIGMEAGTPVYAIADGYIQKYDFPNKIYNGENGKCGNQIAMIFPHDDSPTGYSWANYCHLSLPVDGIKEGDFVKGGTLIGYSGGIPGEPGAGNTTGAHLHLRIEVGGDRYGSGKHSADPDTYETWFSDAKVPPRKSIGIGGIVGSIVVLGGLAWWASR